MKRVLLAGLIFAPLAMADEYNEGRVFALNAQSGVLSSVSQLPPENYLNDYTNNPPESGFNPSQLKATGQNAVATNETAQHILKDKLEREKERVVIDLNSQEMRNAGQAIESADETIKHSTIPCKDGNCLPTPDEIGTDFGEGASRLGVLAGAANEVSTQQIGSQNVSLFKGFNNQCRIAALHVGNCCGGNARFLNCREEEKELGRAKNEGRALFIGKYCAHKKLKLCTEYKESWCVFPSKLAMIIQIQGRYWQLQIPFGWAKRSTNAANCRGISPEELELIQFDRLDLTSLTKEFESKAVFKDPLQLDASSAQKIEQMDREGRFHDEN